MAVRIPPVGFGGRRILIGIGKQGVQHDVVLPVVLMFLYPCRGDSRIARFNFGMEHGSMDDG